MSFDFQILVFRYVVSFLFQERDASVGSTVQTFTVEEMSPLDIIRIIWAKIIPLSRLETLRWLRRRDQASFITFSY